MTKSQRAVYLQHAIDMVEGEIHDGPMIKIVICSMGAGYKLVTVFCKTIRYTIH